MKIEESPFSTQKGLMHSNHQTIVYGSKPTASSQLGKPLVDFEPHNRSKSNNKRIGIEYQ